MYSKAQIDKSQTFPIQRVYELLNIDHNVRGDWLYSSCPSCGGSDRFHVSVSSNVWRCRKCDDQFSHGAVRFMTDRIGMKFPDAMGLIDNQDTPLFLPPVSSECQPLPDFTKIYHMMRRGMTFDSAPYRYAAERGLSERVLRLYGVANGGRGQSLAFPYWNDGKVTGIKFRNLAGDQRYCLMPKSRMIEPFGATTLEGRDYLFICEGELNCLSVREVADVDSISFGSESIGKVMLPYIVELAANYADVIVWTDRKSTAEQLMELIPQARGGASSEDANDKLKRGILPQILAERGIPMAE